MLGLACLPSVLLASPSSPRPYRSTVAILHQLRKPSRGSFAHLMTETDAPSWRLKMRKTSGGSFAHLEENAGN